MIAYFETSAIVKILISEDDSPIAAEIWGIADLPMSSRLTGVEVRSALARAARARRISRGTHRLAKRALDVLSDRWQKVEATEEIVAQAGELAEVHALRAYDAMHLASASATDPAETVFVTWDRALARAARAHGLAVGGAKP